MLSTHSYITTSPPALCPPDHSSTQTGGRDEPAFPPKPSFLKGKPGLGGLEGASPSPSPSSPPSYSRGANRPPPPSYTKPQRAAQPSRTLSADQPSSSPSSSVAAKAAFLQNKGEFRSSFASSLVLKPSINIRALFPHKSFWAFWRYVKAPPCALLYTLALEELILTERVVLWYQYKTCVKSFHPATYYTWHWKAREKPFYSYGLTQLYL